MREVKRKRTIVWALAFCLSFVLPCGAQEVKYPVPSYEGDELAKLREWEKTWVGKKVDRTNVDQVAEFLPEGWITVMKDPETWHTQNYWFEIVPYTPWMPSKGYIEATKKHAAIAKEKGFEGKEGDILVTYRTEAGFPFPEPKTGLECAWNLHFQNEGESFINVMPKEKVRVMDLKTGTNRLSQAKVTHLWFAARTERDPKPMLPEKLNPRNIRWAYFREHFHPETIKGNRLLTIKYNDPVKPDDSWNWLSQFKRIRRYVATQKMDSIDGTDRCYEDDEKHNNKLQYQTYKLLGRKELLTYRGGDTSGWTVGEDQAFWIGVQMQRINTYVVEATPKDKSHVYSKRVWHIDPETFLIVWDERYDRLGRYWRLENFWTHPVQNDAGEYQIFHKGSNQCDLTRIHGGCSQYDLVEMTPDIDPLGYSLRGLRRAAY